MSQELHLIFGTGQVGQTLMHELIRRGRRVRMVSRKGLTNVPERVEVVKGDAADTAFTTEAAKGASVVYNTLNAPYTEWPEWFPKMQAGVLTGAAKAEAKLVVLENLYMYGSTQGQPLREDLPYAASGKKGKVRAEMAVELLEAHQRGIVRTTSVRAADFIGPGVNYGPVADLFLNALNRKAIQLPGSLDNPHALSYVPDVATALAILGEADEALGQAWHLPNPPELTLRELVAKISEEIGQPIDVSVIPMSYMEQAATQNPMIAEMLEQAYFFTEPYLVDASRFEQTFGKIATTWEKAIPATVNWYRQNPVLAAH